MIISIIKGESVAYRLTIKGTMMAKRPGTFVECEFINTCPLPNNVWNTGEPDA